MNLPHDKLRPVDVFNLAKRSETGYLDLFIKRRYCGQGRIKLLPGGRPIGKFISRARGGINVRFWFHDLEVELKPFVELEEIINKHLEEFLKKHPEI